MSAVFRLAILLGWLAMAGASSGQSLPPSGFGLGIPSSESDQTSQWTFGVDVAAAGPARDVTVVFPIPIETPEQTLTLVDQNQSPLVGNVKVDDSTPGIRLVVARIPRIPAGATVSVRFNFRVDKRETVAPENPDAFRHARSPNSKLRAYLLPSPFIESSHPKIKKLASEIPLPEGATPWTEVEAIYDWVRETIEYRFDTQIKSCLEALQDGHGDCEEMSSLFIAICRAKGIPARAVWIPQHTYAEFYLEDAEGEGQWFPCQLAGSRQFGEMLEPKPILQKGDKFKIPGHSQPLRYAQPSLFAKDVQGEMSLRSVMEQTDGSAGR